MATASVPQISGRIPAQLSDEEKEAICQMRREGAQDRVIAEKFGLKYPANVSQVCLKAGVHSTKRGGVVNDEQRKEIKRMRELGKSYREISEVLGVSAYTIALVATGKESSKVATINSKRGNNIETNTNSAVLNQLDSATAWLCQSIVRAAADCGIPVESLAVRVAKSIFTHTCR